MGKSIFIVILLGMLLLGVPIGLSLLGSTFFYLEISNQQNFLSIVPMNFYKGMSSFALLAIPMFILAAEIMNASGITRSLVRFSTIFLGRLPGSLAQINIASNVLFAALCGSGAASVSAIGGMLIPEMEKAGYRRDFATAVTASSAVIGTIIPPSIIMIIYGFVMQVPVEALFAAGIIPGVLFGGALMLYTFIYARRHNLPTNNEKLTPKEVLSAFKDAFWAVLTPVIILGAIFSGKATPTEAAALAVSYSLFVGLVITRKLKLKAMFPMAVKAAKTSASLLLIVGGAFVFSWVLSLSQLPVKISQFLVGSVDNVYLMLLIFNLLMLILGMFVDATATVLVLGPIIVPALIAMGVDPIHVGVIFCVNLSMGNITPPFGTCLFVGSAVGQVPIERLFRRIIPFLAVQIGVLMIITYVPIFSLALPKLLGLL
ncbi:MAG: TRAP transporter large permease [Niabella sp.]